MGHQNKLKKSIKAKISVVIRDFVMKLYKMKKNNINYVKCERKIYLIEYVLSVNNK